MTVYTSAKHSWETLGSFLINSGNLKENCDNYLKQILQ